MKRNKARVLYLLLATISIFALTACHVPDPKDEVNRPQLEKTTDGLESPLLMEYEDLLKVKKNKLNIVSFIDENIDKLDKEDFSLMIVKLEKYLEDNSYDYQESYILLNKYKQYLSLEVKSYLNILFTEVSSPFIYGENVSKGLEELARRIKTSEDHIVFFPKGLTRERIEDLYRKYVEMIIIEGEHRNILTIENTSLVKDDVIKLYESLINEDKKRGISKILGQYLGILEANKRDINSAEVRQFYKQLEEIIIDEINSIG